MQVPGNLTAGTAAGGVGALLLTSKLTVLTMWYFGISDASAPFEVIDAATTVITWLWAGVLTALGAVVGHFLPTQAKEVFDVQAAGLSDSTAGAGGRSLPAGDAAAAGPAAGDGVRNVGQLG